MPVYKSLAVTWMKLVFLVIVIVCVGLTVREIWAHNFHPIPYPMVGGGFCATPMFTGGSLWKHVLQILLSGASLLPIAIAPWLISRVVAFIPLPTEHQLSELWWTIRGRNG